jgi:curved DNA-binding protein CbpA
MLCWRSATCSRHREVGGWDARRPPVPTATTYGGPLRHSRKPRTVSSRLARPPEQSRAANTLYDTLEVIPTASPETIHAAYRSLISRNHPDKVAGLGPELQAVANARTKEINHAYHILRDAARRASYDKKLRESADSSLRRQGSTVAQRASAATPVVREPWGRRLLAMFLAMLLAALAGIAVLALPHAATEHTRFFQGFRNSMDANVRNWGLGYLLVLWGWLFVSYLLGLISYRLSIHFGERIASGFGELFAGTNDRLFLFLTFVCVIAGGELLFSAHTMINILAGMFVVAGAYRAERTVT